MVELKRDIRSMDLDELKEYFAKIGEKPFRAGQVYDWLHVKLAASFDEMTNISKDLREKLKQEWPEAPISLHQRFKSKLDGTEKYLFRLRDGQIIESVLMRYHFGNSVCITSQAGCRMGCKFCASTLLGLERNLEPAEMLMQVYYIQKITGERVSNIVVMGIGEPMDNYDNLMRFLRIITGEKGLNIGARQITVSSCGLADKIRKFADEGLAINLALSLHAPNAEIRRSIMPIANAYELGDVLDAVDYYYKQHGRRITFEYSLISGINDSDKNAEELSRLLGKKYKFSGNMLINLIPVNEVKERGMKRPDEKRVESFRRVLDKNGINATVRRELGSDINAACGQLRLNTMREEKKSE